MPAVGGPPGHEDHLLSLFNPSLCKRSSTRRESAPSPCARGRSGEGRLPNTTFTVSTVSLEASADLTRTQQTWFADRSFSISSEVAGQPHRRQ